MKKKFRKVVAVILTMAMTMSVGMPAFAGQYENSVNNGIELEVKGMEELYYDATDLGYEQLFCFSNGTYYYRNVLPERVLVISDNGIYREVVINELDNWGVLQYSIERIEEQNILTTDTKDYSVEHFRNMITTGYIENLEYVTKNYQKEVSSISTRATIDTEVRNSIYEAFDDKGESLESSSERLIYGKVIENVLTTVYESCEITMNPEVVASTIEKLMPVADVLSLFTLKVPTNVLELLDMISTVISGVSVLEEDVKVDRTNVFKRESRDGRVGSKSIYTATKSTKWVAETVRTVDTNKLVTWYQYIRTNYSSDLYNDLSGLCDRVYHDYKL